MLVIVQPIGPVPDDVLDAVASAVEGALGARIRRSPPWPAPGFARDPDRDQYSAPAILMELKALSTGGSPRILGVTESDLFIPMLSFVFGQAQLRGPLAVVSLARLRQEFYGLPPDNALLLSRAAKEVLHELGHTFGLVHCPDTLCAMSLSADILQVDRKQDAYCEGCASLIREEAHARSDQEAVPRSAEDSS